MPKEQTQFKGGHTPGVWTVGKAFQPSGRSDNNPVLPIYARSGCEACGRGSEWLVAWTFKNATPNWHGNAALLAAAPDLLRALQGLLDAYALPVPDYEMGWSAQGVVAAAEEDARAALAKARGVAS